MWPQECTLLGSQNSEEIVCTYRVRAKVLEALLCALHFLKVIHSKTYQSCVWSSLLPHVESVLGSLQPEEQ